MVHRESAYRPLLNPLHRAETWVGEGSIAQDSDPPPIEKINSAPTHPLGVLRPLRGTKEQDIEEVAVDNQLTGRSQSEELKARRRFIALFRKKHKNEADKEETTTDLAVGEPPKAKRALKHKPFTVGNQLRATIFNSWLNILLLAVPAGYVVNYLHINPIAVFFVNFAAILPLTTLFSYAIDEVRLRYKGVGGMLVYMGFG